MYWHGLEVTLMSKQTLQAEKQYYIARSIAKSMLVKGIIDEDVFTVIDTNLLEKYQPISATLLSDTSLTL